VFIRLSGLVLPSLGDADAVVTARAAIPQVPYIWIRMGFTIAVFQRGGYGQARIMLVLGLKVFEYLSHSAAHDPATSWMKVGDQYSVSSA